MRSSLQVISYNGRMASRYGELGVEREAVDKKKKKGKAEMEAKVEEKEKMIMLRQDKGTRETTK